MKPSHLVLVLVSLAILGGILVTRDHIAEALSLLSNRQNIDIDDQLREEVSRLRLSIKRSGSYKVPLSPLPNKVSTFSQPMSVRPLPPPPPPPPSPPPYPPPRQPPPLPPCPSSHMKTPPQQSKTPPYPRQLPPPPPCHCPVNSSLTTQSPRSPPPPIPPCCSSSHLVRPPPPPWPHY